MKQSQCLKLFAVIVSITVGSSHVWATGPRVTQALLSPSENQIYTDDFPPFSSTDISTGGFAAEIINTAMKGAKLDFVQTTLPLQRMVKFYLKQEGALAIYGRHLSFTKKENKNLIYIPIVVNTEKYFYYSPAHKNELTWTGNLKAFNSYTYGAQTGENTDKYKKAGVRVQYGRTHSLLKKMITKKVDFISAPDINMQWMIDKYFLTEKDNIKPVNGFSKLEALSVIFNKRHKQGALAAKAFKKELAAMVKDGRYLAIVKKYAQAKDKPVNYVKRLANYNKSSNR